MLDPDKLAALHEAATPGPYRVHDHTDMERVGGVPAEWVGYAWVGRVCKESGPNGEFDAGWFKTDRRKDGSVEYRQRASADAHLIAYLCNAVPDIIALIAERDELKRANDTALRECAKWAREAGEAKGRLEGSEAAGVVAGWQEKCERLAVRCERLENLALRASGIFMNCLVEDGMCCCGEEMYEHSNPPLCGHFPVDHGSYQASKWMEDFAALKEEV